MPTYHFTLIVDGPDLQDERWVDRVFEAGCDDTTIGRSEGVQYIAFDRDAVSFDEAVASALHDIEGVGGVDVLEVRREEP